MEGRPAAPDGRRDYEERALRVSQLDAEELDQGLVSMLSSKLTRAMAAFGPVNEHRFTPELHIILKITLYLLGSNNLTSAASPGMKLQNVRFSNGLDRRKAITRRTLILNILLSPLFLPGYILTRLKLHALSSSYPDYPRGSLQRRWWLLLDRLETIGKWMELTSWVLFLWDGKYPNVILRLLNLRMVPSDPFGNVTRMVSYEFMNRQLVWSSFTDFLVFILPLLQSTQIHRILPKLLTRIKRTASTVMSQSRQQDYSPTSSASSSKENVSSSSPQQVALKEKPRPKLWSLPKHTCAICHARIHTNLDSRLGLPIPDTPASTILAGEADDQQEQEDTMIHIATKADCAEGCMYCYHCLAGALTERARIVQAQAGKKPKEPTGETGWFGLGSSVEEEARKEEEGGGWQCLRCGGQVWSCTRVTDIDD